MENETKLGMNRTGMQMAPFEGPSQVEYAQEMPPHPAVDEGEAKALRARYVREAERIGSVPVPASMKGVAATTVDMLKGKNPEVLMDKLGQRAAYERSGTRLYEAAMVKVEAIMPDNAAELLADLKHIRDEELAHFHMLTQVIHDLGGDPTAQTPSADVSGVAALGILQVITDPRTTVTHTLEALLTAELTDHACWELLIELAQQAGHDEMVGPFRQAIQSEQEHLNMINKWLRLDVLGDAGAAPPRDAT